MSLVSPSPEPLGTSAALAAFITDASASGVSETARTWARHVLLDWAAVTVAGAREPASDVLRAEITGRADEPCTVIAADGRASPVDAALLNGTAGHALDFDDVNAAMMGHPTAVVAPAALAVGEALGVSGRSLLDAIAIGHEVAGTVGAMTGRAHYDNGFHVTGTVGTFAAAAAAAALMRLDADAAEMALGLAATQASGLKVMFGTMAKPLHAGKAAANGVLAARLAARGFEAGRGAIEAPQGFMATQAPGFERAPVRPDPDAPFHIEASLFKYHAACYLTHATIEAVRALREREGLTLDDLASMTIYADPSNQRVCDIREPETGLNVKFAIRHLAALALDGRDTADLSLFSDATAREPRLVEARRRVAFEGRTLAHRHQAAVLIETRDGRSLLAEENVGVPATDLSRQWARLVDKAQTLTPAVIGDARTAALIEAVDTLDTAPDLSALTAAMR